LNLRPSGYEPDELPGCSTPRHHVVREFRLICADAFSSRALQCKTVLPWRHEAVDARVRGCSREPGEAPARRPLSRRRPYSSFLRLVNPPRKPSQLSCRWRFASVACGPRGLAGQYRRAKPGPCWAPTEPSSSGGASLRACIRWCRPRGKKSLRVELPPRIKSGAGSTIPIEGGPPSRSPP
jgi:hypothetical protein